MNDDPEDLKKQIAHWSGKYESLKKKYIALEQSTFKYKLRKKSDKFWSVFAVFLNASDGGTTFIQKVKMFFGTMWAWAKNGFKLEQSQVAEAGFAICNACPELINESRCNLCGCFMRTKTKIAGASCPLKKW